MDVKKIVLLIGALIVAAVTAIMAKNMFTGASAPTAAAAAAPAPVPGTEVLVATRPLPIGTLIDAESVKYQVWPEGLVQPAYFVKGEAGVDPASLIGTVVRNEISAGQPLTQGSLIKPGERGFLAAALGPGMRAVTVPINATGSVAGFIFPGDRVDLLLTQDVTGGGDGQPLKVTETIIRNLRVLATDQRLTGVNEEGKPVVLNMSMVTFEATPKIAEKIAVAQTLGSLSMSLRSIADNTAELERAIASGDVKIPAGTDPAAEKKMIIEIAGKPVDTTPTFTVGGDVSRFRRKSVPSKPVTADPNGQTGPGVKIARGASVVFVPLGAK
jgi:pilus assembly protein CpaB